MIGQSPEAYTWRAVYNDGTSIDEDEENGFADVDQSKVKSLFLLPFHLPQHQVDIPHGCKPIFFRRHPLEINLLSGQENAHPTIHCIGWKSSEKAVYLFVFQDGSVLLTDDLQAV